MRPIICVLLANCFSLFICSATAETIYEAENARLSPPAKIIEHDGSRAGLCVRLSEVNALEHVVASGADSAKLGRIAFNVEVPADAKYTLWARLQWHCMCGRGLLVRADGANKDADGTPVSSNAPPLVWHWAKMGTYTLRKGLQTIEFAQWGHLTLLDAITLSPDPDYRPPGYIDEAHVFSLEESKYIAASNKKGPRFRFGDRDWTYFTLNTVLSLPETSGSGMLGVAFGVTETNRYEFRIERMASDATLVSSLVKISDQQETVLAQKNGIDGTGVPHLIGITRAGSSAAVSIDGCAVLGADSVPVIAGAIEAFSRDGDALQIQETKISSLDTYEEHFAAEPIGWKVKAGEWRLVKPDAVEGPSNFLLCDSETDALYQSAWVTGDNYTFSADVRASETGGAGLAFNIGDDSYCAFLLNKQPSADPQSARLSLDLFNKSGIETLWTRNFDFDPQQWHRLAMHKSNESIVLMVDGNAVGRVKSGMWALFDKGVGLAAFKARGATFSSVKAETGTAEGDSEYTFWGPTNSSSLCQWRIVKGTNGFNEYSGALVLTPTAESGFAQMTLRRTVSGQCSVAVEFSETGSGTEKTSAGGSLATFPSPILPGDPIFSIVVASADGKRQYKTSFDVQDLRDISLTRDGEVVKHAQSQRPAARGDRKVLLQIDGPKVIAEISNGPRVEFEEDNPLTDKDNCTMTLMLESPLERTAISLGRIVVGKTFKQIDLPHTTESNNKQIICQ